MLHTNRLNLNHTITRSHQLRRSRRITTRHLQTTMTRRVTSSQSITSTKRLKSILTHLIKSRTTRRRRILIQRRRTIQRHTLINSRIKNTRQHQHRQQQLRLRIRTRHITLISPQHSTRLRTRLTTLSNTRQITRSTTLITTKINSINHRLTLSRKRFLTSQRLNLLIIRHSRQQTQRSIITNITKRHTSRHNSLRSQLILTKRNSTTTSVTSIRSKASRTKIHHGTSSITRPILIKRINTTSRTFPSQTIQAILRINQLPLRTSLTHMLIKGFSSRTLSRRLNTQSIRRPSRQQRHPRRNQINNSSRHINLNIQLSHHHTHQLNHKILHNRHQHNLLRSTSRFHNLYMTRMRSLNSLTNLRQNIRIQSRNTRPRPLNTITNRRSQINTHINSSPHHRYANHLHNNTILTRRIRHTHRLNNTHIQRQSRLSHQVTNLISTTSSLLSTISITTPINSRRQVTNTIQLRHTQLQRRLLRSQRRLLNQSITRHSRTHLRTIQPLSPHPTNVTILTHSHLKRSLSRITKQSHNVTISPRRQLRSLMSLIHVRKLTQSSISPTLSTQISSRTLTNSLQRNLSRSPSVNILRIRHIHTTILHQHRTHNHRRNNRRNTSRQSRSKRQTSRHKTSIQINQPQTVKEPITTYTKPRALTPHKTLPTYTQPRFNTLASDIYILPSQHASVITSQTLTDTHRASATQPKRSDKVPLVTIAASSNQEPVTLAET